MLWASFLEVVWVCAYVLPRKGAALQAADVRTIITDYVKKNELVDDNNKK